MSVLGNIKSTRMMAKRKTSALSRKCSERKKSPQSVKIRSLTRIKSVIVFATDVISVPRTTPPIPALSVTLAVRKSPPRFNAFLGFDVPF